MSIILNEGQSKGLEICINRYKKGMSMTCIAGYAGCGKTELVKFVISELGLKEEEVVYTSYTGKAAMILRQRGNKNAITLHRLLYKAILTNDGRYILRPKESLSSSLKLIIVDEVSMPPLKLMQQLAKHGIHIICLGDPGQLPPVSGQDNGILQNPHVMLTEIMRQAEESEIIKVTMDIRHGRPLEKFQGKEVQIIDKCDVVSGMYKWADQIICARNDTRRQINNYCRSLSGRGSTPEEGDKVICLANNWDCLAPDETALVNGLTGTLKNPENKYNYAIKKKDIVCDFIPDFESLEAALGVSNEFKQIRIDSEIFKTGETTLTLSQKAILLKDKKKYHMIPNEFDYGYAVTCHKAQGDQFNKVLVFEENFPFKAEEHRRWLYTACSRAKEKLIIVRK